MTNWKQIQNYENYEVSTSGEIRNKTTQKTLKQCVNRNGYMYVTVRPDGRTGATKAFRVHREVAIAFCNNLCKYNYVNHIDGNKLNNTSINLEWCTHSHNMFHAFSTGLKHSLHGYDNPYGKLSKNDVEYIKHNYVAGCKVNGCRALARKFNVDHSTISRMISGESYQTSN